MGEANAKEKQGAGVKDRMLSVLMHGREITGAISGAQSGEEHRKAIVKHCEALEGELGAVRQEVVKYDEYDKDFAIFGLDALQTTSPGVAIGGACPAASKVLIHQHMQAIRDSAAMQTGPLAQVAAP